MTPGISNQPMWTNGRMCYGSESRKGGIPKDQEDRDIPLEESMRSVSIDRRLIRLLHAHE